MGNASLSLSDYLTNKRNWALLGLLILVLSIDFAYRVWVGGSAERQKEFRQPDIKPVASALASDQVLARLRSLIPLSMGGVGVVEKQLSLSGIMISDSDPMAVLRIGSGESQPSQFVRVRTGAIVEGWKVLEVDRRSVTISREDESKVLELFPRPSGVVSK